MPTLQCNRNHTVPFTEDDRGGEVYCPVCGIVCEVPASEAPSSESSDGLRCRNGHVIQFTEDDRGGEVYCRSCGVACPVPAADSPAGERRRKASVFTAAGETQVAERVIGQTPCPQCSQPVAYTVADYGESVYCTKCGAGVQVGENLQQVVAARQQAETGPGGVTPITASTTNRRVRLILTAVLLVGLLLGGGIFVTWQFPDDMPFDARTLPWNKALIAGSGSAEPEISQTPAPPPPPPKPRPDLKIKHEMIDRLLKREDVAAALENALTWQDVLIAYQTPKNDPRILALARVIPELQKKLEAARPKAATGPTPDDKCLDALDAMLRAIKAYDLAAGRKVAQQVEAMFKLTPELAKRYSERFEAQKAQLDELAKKPQPPRPDKTVADVQLILDEVEGHLKKGEVTEAMEARARAMFLAPRVALTPDDKQELSDRIKSLTTAIHKARGKRAVTDSEKCFTAGDAAAVKLLIAEARKDLPEFTKEAEYRTSFNTAEALAKKTISKPVTTDFGKFVIFRHEYEAMLDGFREDRIALAAEIADRARSLAPDEAWRTKTVDLAADALDTVLITTSPGNKDQARRAELRAALTTCKSSLPADRWSRLDTALRGLDKR